MHVVWYILRKDLELLLESIISAYNKKYKYTVYSRKTQWLVYLGFLPFSLFKQKWKVSKIMIEDQDIQNESMDTRKCAHKTKNLQRKPRQRNRWEAGHNLPAVREKDEY